MTIALDGPLFAFLLVFARAGAVIMLLPGFANPGPPANIRLAFAVLVALALTQGQGAAAPERPETLVGLAILIIGEVLIGLAIGLLVRLVMVGLSVAGQIVSLQTSLAMAQSFDPTQQQSSAIFGSFLNLTGVALIFASGLHHEFLRGIAGSYAVFPPGAVLAAGDFAALSIDTLAEAFAVGVRMAAPLIVFGVVFNVGLGVLSKLMPQAQVYFMAMPLAVLAGLTLFALTLGAALLVWLDSAQTFARTLV